MPEISEQELAELRKAAKEGAKAQALYDGLKVEYDKLKPLEARVPELESQVKAFHAEKLDGQFKAAGVTDPKIRKIFEMEYADLQAAEGQEKPALDAWLKSLQESPADKRPAHLAPFLAAPPAAGAAGAPPPRVAAPDVNKGASGVQGAPSQFTPEMISKWTPEQLRQNASALEAQFPGLLQGLQQFVNPPAPKG